MNKTKSQCTPEEALAYLQAYLATVDSVSEAQAKFDSLAGSAGTLAERSKYRAMSLEAERDLELLVNKRRAFLNNDSAIRPPSAAEVKKAVDLSKEVASINATAAKVNQVFALMEKAFKAFSDLG